MQRILVLKPPYGTAFMFAPNQGGGPHNIWLRYDSASDAAVLEWLRDTLSYHEDYLRQISQSVPPPAEAPEITVAPPQKAVLDKIQNMTSQQGGHDWGAPYKFGLTCARCKQVANGLETRCAQAPAKEWKPVVGKRAIDKRTGTSYVIEGGGENGRWLMLDGPVLMTEQLGPDPSEV